MEELEQLLKLLNANGVLAFEGLGYKVEFAEADPEDAELTVDSSGWDEIPVGTEPN